MIVAIEGIITKKERQSLNPRLRLYGATEVCTNIITKLVSISNAEGCVDNFTSLLQLMLL